MADRETPLTREQARDDEFRRIFDAHYGRVFRFFLSRGLPREEAHDFAQETFLRVYRGLPALRAEQTVETWLFQIAVNLWRSHVRRSGAMKRRGSEVSLDQVVEGDELGAAGALPGHQEDDLLEEERFRLLRAVIAELPPIMRHCVLLRARGYRYREIAAVLQISTDSVKAHLYQGRHRLQTRLGNSFTDPEI